MTGPRADSPGPELEELLGRASKISQQAEAFHIQHTDEPVHFEANRVKQVETRESSGAALRIIKDGRIGFSSTSDFKNIQSLIDRTLETASFGPQAFFSFPSLQGFNPVQVYDPETISVPVEEMVDLGQSAIDRLVGSWPELLCDATVTKGDNHPNVNQLQGRKRHLPQKRLLRVHPRNGREGHGYALRV